MATWTLEPERKNLHGHYSRDLPPILTIESGDTVEYTTLEATWTPIVNQVGPVKYPREKVEPRDQQLDAGHCLVGPISIRGAAPGTTLEVRVNEVRPGNWGWTALPGWPHPVHERLGFKGGSDGYHLWNLDPETNIGVNQYGHKLSLRPFMGVMGMPTDEAGILPTAPPRATGGNLDCKEIVAGTSLFLPVAVAGGLFSVGDGHAVQGDGEVSVTAIECPMERLSLTFTVHPDLRIPGPRVRTANAWMTLGVDADLHEAAMKALDDMLDLMGTVYGVDRAHALTLASLVVDMRITQLANGVLGVHAVLPDDAIRGAAPGSAVRV